ncbi:flavin reductase family protein [Pigmentiphaga soli]|uniref:Flavin reductase family protein n=1 Tax=Pigmentiphaga soli TaxID=1007095 RepID=A0ABP8H934_9BURK
MFYDASEKPPLPYDPFKALVAPRPIGWISTVSREGHLNLAPYSFFQAIAQRPGMVIFTSEGRKDSVDYAVDTGEFVCNQATWDFRDQLLLSSDDLPRGENEFLHAGLEWEPSRLVRPPRVKGVAAALECRVVSSFELTDLAGNGANRMAVIGQVVGVYIDDRFIKDGRVDTAAMRVIARCGYFDYAVIDDYFQMRDRKIRAKPSLVNNP